MTISLALSFTLVPVLVDRFLPPGTALAEPRFVTWIKRIYRPGLDWALRHGLAVQVIALLVALWVLPGLIAVATPPLVVERQWLQSWFNGTPVRIAQQGSGPVDIAVPQAFCFDTGRSSVKPPLAAVLDKLNNRIKLAIHWAGLTQTNAGRSQAVLISSDPAVEQGLKDVMAETSAQVGKIQKTIDSEELTTADRNQLETIAGHRKKVLETRALAMKQRADNLPVESAGTVTTQ